MCYSGYVLDIENRPIEGAVIADESSSAVSKSYKNGSYTLPVKEGKFYIWLLPTILEKKSSLAVYFFCSLINKYYEFTTYNNTI